MGFDIRRLLAKAKNLLTESPIPQLACFIISKVFFALMELPHQTKAITYIPFLLLDLIFILLAIALKLFRHKMTLIRILPQIQSHCFLLWSVNFIMMVFSWALLSATDWNLFEIILVMTCELFSLFMLTLLTHDQFISTFEFVVSEIVLGL
jgi:hypothetical protein